MIGILDSGAANVQSVKNSLAFLGYPSIFVTTPEDLEKINRIIIPGVGRFATMMSFLEKSELRSPLLDMINSGIPTLGICLGYQVLFETSEESPGVKGLSILKGNVKRFEDVKVPQIGWNLVEPSQRSKLLQKGYMYFINSYFPVPETGIVSALSEYGEIFASAIEFENIVATQFHPEKSGLFGLQFLKRWISC